MNMIEESGHVWDGDGENRCRRCQMRYSYYIAFKKSGKALPCDQELRKL